MGSRMVKELILKHSRRAFFLEYILVILALTILLTNAIKGSGLNGFLVIAIVIAALAGLIRPEIIRMREVCVITPEAVTIKRGILSKREHQFHMSSITDVNYEQSVWQRIWNYGNLIIRSFSHAGKRFRVGNIRNPKEVMATIHRLVDQKVDKPVPKALSTGEE